MKQQQKKIPLEIKWASRILNPEATSTKRQDIHHIDKFSIYQKGG